MAQFDVHPNPNPATRGAYPYLVDIQSPHLDDLATRIVIPLARRDAFDRPLPNLTPELIFQDQDLLLLTPQLSSIRAKRLSMPVGTLAHLRDRIIAALDFAITGF